MFKRYDWPSSVSELHILYYSIHSNKKNNFRKRSEKDIKDRKKTCACSYLLLHKSLINQNQREKTVHNIQVIYPFFFYIKVSILVKYKVH